ncbi:MAG: type IV pilus assembly protein PilM [Patescibacteria group bacterium]
MSIVGLDLGTYSIKALEIDEIKGNKVLKNFTVFNDAKLNLESNTKEDLDYYSEKLKEIFSENGFTSNQVIVSLPESDVFTRVIKVPQMGEKDLKSSIAFEAEQYIPLPLKEVNYDFQIIDTDSIDKNKMDVLLVAAKQAVLSKYVAILKDAKLVPKGLEPETLAIGRVLGDNPSRPSASIILNMGELSTEIIVTYKGYVRFTRSISMGGDTLSRSLAQALNFDFNQAEEYKKTYGLDSTQADGKVYEVLKPLFDNITAEIKRSKIFYTTHNPNVIINRVILSGGAALMPGLLFYMANNLDLEVELANPWRNIRISEKILSKKEYLTDSGPMFVTAVGLAMKGLAS